MSGPLSVPHGNPPSPPFSKGGWGRIGTFDLCSKRNWRLFLGCLLFNLPAVAFQPNFFTNVPPSSATAINTVPTGVFFVPPVGPATPVVDNPKVVLKTFRTPSAMRFATCRLTAPYLSIYFQRNTKVLSFRLDAVGNNSSLEIVRASGDIGNPIADQSSGTGLSHGEGHSMISQKISDRFFSFHDQNLKISEE